MARRYGKAVNVSGMVHKVPGSGPGNVSRGDPRCCPVMLSRGVVPLSRSVCPEVMSRGVGPCRLLIFFFSRREADSATGRGAGRTWLAVAVLHVRVRGCSSVSIVTCPCPCWVSVLGVCAGCVRVWLCGCARVCVIMAVRVGCECWLCVLAVQASVGCGCVAWSR